MSSKTLLIIISCSAFSLAVPAAAQSVGVDPSAESSAEGDVETSSITVTGAREQRRREATTGSRLPRREPLVRFMAVATETGVAGLTPGSGMDPFAGGTRNVTERACRSDDARLSQEAACRFVPIQHFMNSGSFEEARAAIDRLVTSESVTDEERYLAAGYLYRIAVATREDVDREDALRMMIGTTSMAAGDRIVAYRTLISIALRRNDRPAAIDLLEHLVQISPDDARSRANLASLYAESGRSSDAARLVRDAIAVARRKGEPVPAEWLNFASSGEADVASTERRP